MLGLLHVASIGQAFPDILLDARILTNSATASVALRDKRPGEFFEEE
jgi:hypothetical protein